MFDKYDQAWAKYHKKIKLLPLPLLSWDIFSNPNLEIVTFNTIQKKWINKENYHNQIENKSVIITDSKLTNLFTNKHISGITGVHKYAISKKHPFKEVILNYRKDGSTYMCEIEAYPKFDQKNNLTHFIAFERIAS